MASKGKIACPPAGDQEACAVTVQRGMQACERTDMEPEHEQCPEKKKE